MKRFRIVWLLALGGLSFVGMSGHGQTAETPDFQEVYTIVRSNLTKLSESDLNSAAVAGLIAQLNGQAVLVTNETRTVDSKPDETSIAEAKVFDQMFGYIRVAKVTSGLPNAFSSAYDGLGATNKLKGLVIDLRFAGGHDYSAVVDVASRFIESEQPLFRLGDEMTHSRRTEDPITLSAAILVNEQTTGPAEVLAAVLRQADTGLVIGGPTPGQAHPLRDFRLSNGQIMKLASGTVELANGKMLTGRGVVPDIRLNVSAADEKAYLDDPYWTANRGPNPAGARSMAHIPGASILTNRFGRRRMNEAELVRMQREGLDLNRDVIPATTEPARPTIQDPTLGRALDFLKGMAVTQNRR